MALIRMSVLGFKESGGEPLAVFYPYHLQLNPPPAAPTGTGGAGSLGDVDFVEEAKWDVIVQHVGAARADGEAEEGAWFKGH